jgi:long-chain acyl-CoA synthetase
VKESHSVDPLVERLLGSVRAHRNSIALRLGDVALTYDDLDHLSARVAGLLSSRGVGPGDRVGVMLPNVPQFPACYWGTLRLGAAVVPMNVMLKARETGFYLTDSGAKVILVWDQFAAAAEAGAAESGCELISVSAEGFESLLPPVESVSDTPEAAPEDTAVILYTSGTTGTPKGAELTHASLGRNAEAAAKLFRLTAEDVVLGALPLFHSFGQTCAMNAALFAGACLTLIPRFDPATALEVLERHRVTVFEGVPTMYGALLNSHRGEDHDVSSLRVCVSGGASLPVEVMNAFEAVFGCKVLEGYGLSETSPVASFNHLDRERKPGSIGTPIEGVEMKVVDEDGNEVPEGEPGEVVIRGHNVMKGYWNRPDATAETITDDGWFKTGDVATVDRDGYFFIVDRKKDLIIRGGYNVYPREIEEVLYEHPAVGEAAVIGVAHNELGEEVGAAVALKPGEKVSEDELREHVKEQVAAYKYPRKIWFVDNLPKGPTGKILKREIQVPRGRNLAPRTSR